MQVENTAGVCAEEPRRITVTDEFGNCLGRWAGQGDQRLGMAPFRADQGSTPGVLVAEVLCERQYDGDAAWYGSRCQGQPRTGAAGKPRGVTGPRGQYLVQFHLVWSGFH